MDTPIKRAAVLVSAFGLVLLGFGLFQLYDIDVTWRCVIDDGRRHWDGCTPTRWGAWLATLGLLFSFGFNYTVGPVWRWILTGSIRGQARPDPNESISIDEAARRLANVPHADWRRIVDLREAAEFRKIIAAQQVHEKHGFKTAAEHDKAFVQAIADNLNKNAR